MNSFFSKIKKQNQYSPYIIAEIGVNHEGSMKNAKLMIEQAARNGANAVKFQTYKADKLASINSPAYWDLKLEKTKSQFHLFKKYDKFNKKDYISLYKYCKKYKIEFCSTPFDLESVDFLNPYVNFFKIASADITNIPLLKKIASKKKPIILSCGASTLNEITYAIKYLKKNGCIEVALLHCILNYPTLNHNANLNKITYLIKKFKKNVIGYSDHTIPDSRMTTLTTACFLGAKIIEKHFTYNKNLPGNDHYHSMNYSDLRIFNQQMLKIKDLLGSSKYSPIKLEGSARLNARRSIVIIKNLKKGSIIQSNNITVKRPGNGISPLDWENVLGKKVNKDLTKDHILTYRDLYK